MSLNRFESALQFYIENHPEERRYWQDKVRSATAATGGHPRAAAPGLERDLQAYLQERSRHVPDLQSLAIGNASRVSLLNLAELMVRLWVPLPRPTKPREPSDRGL